MYKSTWKLNKEKETRNSIKEIIFSIFFFAGMFALLYAYLIAIK